MIELKGKTLQELRICITMLMKMSRNGCRITYTYDLGKKNPNELNH
jgi:hypothetical protein